ncbi:hypothetical protein QCA50_004982 [Cerrena zonata]|uniref:Uncharacterized protein n=1 Tax=Cerrena zonata TaxID=2478898 RepID=A0AAW0GDI7_9APHY
MVGKTYALIFSFIAITSLSHALPVHIADDLPCASYPCRPSTSDLSYLASSPSTFITREGIGNGYALSRRASKVPPKVPAKPPVPVTPAPSTPKPVAPSVPAPVHPPPVVPPPATVPPPPPAAAPPASAPAPPPPSTPAPPPPVTPSSAGPTDAEKIQASSLMTKVAPHIFVGDAKNLFTGRHTSSLLKSTFPGVAGNCRRATGLCDFDISGVAGRKKNSPTNKTAWDDSVWSQADISGVCTQAIALAIHNNGLKQNSAWSVLGKTGSNICLKINVKTKTNEVSSCFPTSINPTTAAAGSVMFG